jgi:CubicO group peptidase (beta-lactamase class C family)
VIERVGPDYHAYLQGWTVPIREDRGELSFTLPDGRGSFQGKRWPDGGIRGIWLPSLSVAGTGGHATPVRLAPEGRSRWLGAIVPIDEVFTLHLLLRPGSDGSLRALMRNTEREWGAPFGIDRLLRNGNSVALMAGRPGRGVDTLTTGWYDPAGDLLTLQFPGRGGSYDFRRADQGSEYYARDPRAESYVYRRPLARDDGWPVSTVDSVGIDRGALESMVRVVAGMGMDSVNAPQVHALLIARHGRLVFEEYCHGEHRDKTHDTRSGSKSVVALLVGAAMQAGLPVRLSTPVFETMMPGSRPSDLDPRKRAMTLEHLLTMSSGFFCDDSNDQAPGQEDKMWSQAEEPDFYRFLLNVPMASAPGEKAFYCSAVANLALGVIGRAAGESPYYLFERLLAEPLGIHRYGWVTDRAGQPFGGGAMQFLTRDYMKLGQLLLNGGTWKGRRILSADFVAKATQIHSRLGSRSRGYGYLWWVEEYPYRNRKIQTYASLGAGGQIVMVIPELDMVVATQGGSYGSTGWRYLGGELIPNHILPSVR